MLLSGNMVSTLSKCSIQCGPHCDTTVWARWRKGQAYRFYLKLQLFSQLQVCLDLSLPHSHWSNSRVPREMRTQLGDMWGENGKQRKSQCCCQIPEVKL